MILNTIKKLVYKFKLKFLKLINQKMASREKKPDVPIDSIKEVVKKLKNQGFDKLSHFDLALALVTIGFKEVSQEFGAKWTSEH